MIIRSQAELRDNDVTDPDIYADRRRFLVMGAGLAAAALSWSVPARAAALNGYRAGAVTLDEKPTTVEAATTYNNFYEFGLDKADPARTAPGRLKIKPWSVAVEGACAKPAVVGIEDLVPPSLLEERIYRLRCVEAWSMVIPWIGVPLASILRRFEPESRAKYVEFTTLADPAQMPGISGGVLDWPYVEGLRLDEAMHPLTLMAVGLYGQELPAQNGAPLRLVVPWKYGFKSIKSIVRIRFTETRPRNTWAKANASEYGFYANVNPEVDHPRWSQATERRIGEFRRRPTLMFNGYGEQVAGLYAGQDLARDF